MEEVMNALSASPAQEEAKTVAESQNWIPHQFDRTKGARWFDETYGEDVIVMGQGGIGSWLSLLLSRIGCTLHTFDMDRYEVHNMTGQLVRAKDVGKLKTIAVAEIVREFNNSADIYTNGQFEADSFVHSIMFAAFDTMASRKLAFNSWKDHLRNSMDSMEREIANSFFFQDGRLLAEQFMIFNIPGNRPDLIAKYEKEHLFDDSEVADVDCTFKQTSHCAAMIASHMVGFFTNWVVNRMTNDPTATRLPFYFEYVIPFNMTMENYANT